MQLTTRTKTWIWILLVVIVVVVVVGIVRLPGSAERRAERAAKQELEAFRSYRDETDPAKRIANMELFLKKYPQSKYTGYAYENIFTTRLADMADTATAVSYARGILASAEPAESKAPLYPALMSLWLATGTNDSVVAIAREALAAPITDGSIYNGMGYELAEKGEHLDLATELCQKAVDLAKEDFEKSYAYDSLGWALLKAGQPAKAVEALQQAEKLAGESVDETILGHLGEAQVVAKDAEGAIKTYLKMMSSGEFSEARAKLDSLYASTKRAPESLEADIKALREARMTPAADFALTSTAGAEVTLAANKGKVVLLDFMSPT
jgi:tetratricopeptide (TPR) repeat protein